MSRSQPYRSKMPIHILQLLDVASRITLFLVGQNGPFCFVFKDRLNNKYKTSIGSTLKCSCSINRNDHCIHTVYVLLKIFKLAPQNPLIWQNAYVDSELSDIISGKHTVADKRRVVRPIFQLNEEQDLPSRFMLQKTIYNNPEHKAQRMVIDEDSVCPICQQSMRDDMCLSYCKVKCGNNFHLECLKIWAEHKSTTQAVITCPMCRTPMGKDYLREIKNQQKQYNTKQVKKAQFKCSGCGVNPIPNSPHKCILCTSYELCECCYQSGKHIKHPFVKRNQNLKWQGAEQRRQTELKMKNYIQNRRKETVNEQLLQKLRKVQQDPSKLLDFIASSYPYVSKYISDNIDPNKQLGFTADDMKCMKCGSKKMIFLRRLNCGHFIDHQCLKEYIRLGKFHCPEDGSKYAKGYQNLVQSEKQIQSPQIPTKFNRQFDPNYQQRQSYNIVHEQLTLADVLSGYTSVQEPSQQLRHRLVSNRVTSRQQNHQKIQKTRQPQIQSNIRVRQVSNSTKKKDQSQPKNLQKKKVNKQSMERMIEFMIGKKVF